MDFPNLPNDFQKFHADLLRSSYHHWTGQQLTSPELDSAEGAKALFNTSFVLLSHDTDKDPILNYANLTGLQLFELSWEELSKMPSRLTAEPGIREKRAHLMNRVIEEGFIDDYSGIRISKTGKRFMIERATVWNLIDKNGTYQGRAATFSEWISLENNSQRGSTLE